MLGRIDPDYFLGGEMMLDGEAARAAVARLADRLSCATMEIAEGIVRIANFIMAGALRRITIERGRDPRDFAMVAQGGGGPIHAVDVARELGIRTVLVPQLPATFSAAGMLVANLRHDDVHSVLARLDEIDPAALEEHYRRLEATSRARIADEAPDAREIVLDRSAEMPYGGQEHTVKVELTGAAGSAEVAARFEQEYARRFGHTSEGVPIEVVSIRVTAEGRLDGPAIDHLGEAGDAREMTAMPAVHREVYFAGAGGFVVTPVRYRAALPPGTRLDGPAVIQEYGSTTVLHPGDRLGVAANGVLVIELGEG